MMIHSDSGISQLIRMLLNLALFNDTAISAGSAKPQLGIYIRIAELGLSVPRINLHICLTLTP